MGIGQPGVQRRKPDLGAVAEQQEHEGDVEQRWVEGPRARDQHGPNHGVETLSDDRARRHIDEDGAEQRERDADAAEDEVFPCRLERLVGAIDTDHEHSGQRRELDRHPHHADVVSDEREIHREHQQLIHRMVEAQEPRREPADVELMADIARAKYAGGEADERGQHDEHVVEVVHQEIWGRLGTAEEQRDRGEEGQESRNDIERCRQPISRQRHEQRRRQRGNCENGGDRFKRSRHPRSPRKRSSACKSTVSKRSRMRNRKMPITMKAMRIEKAMLISTTSGMPLAPVAASTRPFSSDMKPTI